MTHTVLNPATGSRYVEVVQAGRLGKPRETLNAALLLGGLTAAYVTPE